MWFRSNCCLPVLSLQRVRTLLPPVLAMQRSIGARSRCIVHLKQRCMSADCTSCFVVCASWTHHTLCMSRPVIETSTCSMQALRVSHCTRTSPELSCIKRLHSVLNAELSSIDVALRPSSCDVCRICCRYAAQTTRHMTMPAWRSAPRPQSKVMVRARAIPNPR